MTDIELILKIPESVYEPIREVARATEQSVEQVVLGQLRSVLSIELPPLPVDEETELTALRFLSDDTLFGMVGEQMPHADQVRLKVLMDANSHGTLSEIDAAEFRARVERGERLMLRKAWAAGILMERGYKPTLDHFAPDNG